MRPRCVIALLAAMGLAACAPRAATPTTLPATFTSLPPALVTQAAPPTIAPLPPVETPGPLTDHPELAEGLAPTAKPPCVNDAKFITDLTVPDGAQFLPGQPVLKKWQVSNLGSCDWGPDYRLVLIDGAALGAAPEVALYPAKAGATVAWEIPMTAPLAPGVYTGKWQAHDPAGKRFGTVVFIKIEVIPLPDAETPAP